MKSGTVLEWKLCEEWASVNMERLLSGEGHFVKSETV